MRKINYPLIISDFDGTLVRSDGNISDRNKKAIREYVAAGGVFAISTGRLPAGILRRAQELGLTGNICCCQGAIILDIQSKELLLDGRISLDSTLTACKKMETMGLHVHAYDLWDYYSNVDDEALKLYENVVQAKAEVVLDRPLSKFIEEKRLRAYKLLAMVKAEESDEILEKLSAEKIDGCELTKSANFLVEVVNEKYSKGTALEFLADYYGVSMAKTVAIGDQRNDISMIEKAGVGVAVKNADVSLKEKADYICNYTNDEDAVADIIEKFGFYEER